MNKSSESAQTPLLVIVSGLSGSGKTIALRALEDVGFYCTDNLPVNLLTAFAESMTHYPKVAVGLDVRTGNGSLEDFPAHLETLRQHFAQVKVIYLTATSERLIQRFSETRRRHPLAGEQSLIQAIAQEERLLQPLHVEADCVVTTDHTNLHELRNCLWNLVDNDAPLPIVLKSFAFRHGVPADLDLMFDARCLPNPHWHNHLRPLTGRDEAIQEFLDGQAKAQDLLNDIAHMLSRWLPEYQSTHRGQVAVGVGCTGGRHRSVYLIERLAQRLSPQHPDLIVHHRDLSEST